MCWVREVLSAETECHIYHFPDWSTGPLGPNKTRNGRISEKQKHYWQISTANSRFFSSLEITSASANRICNSNRTEFHSNNEEERKPGRLSAKNISRRWIQTSPFQASILRSKKSKWSLLNWKNPTLCNLNNITFDFHLKLGEKELDVDWIGRGKLCLLAYCW